MTCSKCSDIHEAQKCGLTQNPCCCGCHNTSSTSITWNNNSTGWNNNLNSTASTTLDTMFINGTPNVTHICDGINNDCDECFKKRNNVCDCGSGFDHSKTECINGIWEHKCKEKPEWITRYLPNTLKQCPDCGVTK